MKRSDRMILLVLPLAALVVGFYLLAVAPKREEIASLDEEIAALQESAATAESQIEVAEGARRRFSRNYAEVVSLGAAVPAASDQATFIYDLSQLGVSNSVRFQSFEVSASGAPAAAAPPPPPPSEEGEGSGEDGGEDSGEEAPTTPVAAAPTEANAATLPIGSTVGPAGLPVMPYKLKFNGSFFDMADFFADLDDNVDLAKPGEGDAAPAAGGRLVTVNGFAMVGDPVHGFPLVQSSLSVTTYVLPASQGLAAGANPAGPAPIPSVPGETGSTPVGAQAAVVSR